MLHQKERPPLARAALPQCHAGKREHAEDSPARRRLQQLKAARELMDAARLRLLLAQEHLRAAGVDVDGAAFLDDVREIVRDLNRLILAGGDVGLLRPAVSPHVRAAAIDFRAERARRARR